MQRASERPPAEPDLRHGAADSFRRRPKLGWRRWIILVVLAFPSWVVRADTEPIRDLETFRLLSQQEAISERPVSLEATVLYLDPVLNWMFVADGSARAFVTRVSHGVLAPGVRVSIEGRTAPGEVLPVLRSDRVRIVSDAAVLPEPARIDDLGQLSLGDHDSDWVELEADVLQAVIQPEHTVFVARSGETRFFATVAEAMTLEAARDWVGARVRMRGALGYRFEVEPFREPDPVDPRLVSYELFVPSARDLVVREAAVETVWPRERDKVASLYRDWPGARGFHLLGRATAVEARSIVVEDGGAGFRLDAAFLPEIAIGSIVEVAARQDRGGIRAAVVRPLGAAMLRWPPKVGIAEASRPGNRFRRVTVSGAPEWTGEPGASEFLLHGSEGARARVSFTDDVRNLETSQLDTARRIEVTGVALPPAEDGVLPLVVSRVEDLFVVDRSSPFAPRSVAATVGVLFFAVAGSLLWVRGLRNRVAEKSQYLDDTTAQLEASYEAVQEGLVAVDNRGIVLAANRSARAILGCDLAAGDPASRVLDAIDDQLPSTGEVREAFRQARAHSAWRGRFEWTADSPREKAVIVQTAPIPDPKEPRSSLGRLWLLRDETRQRSLERRLLQSQKLEAIGTLAGGVAHDFNNLLTVIRGNLELARSADLSPTLASCLDDAEVATESAGQVVRKLLTFSRTTPVAPRPCDLGELVHEVESMVRHMIDPTIKIQVSVEEGLPLIHGDPVMLEQVLLNLCVNARDAMPDGGTISIAAATASGGPTPEAVMLTVRDTGRGMTEDERAKVFEPFFTTKEPGKGTGLGLSVSYGIVHQHEGTIECDSVPGIGTEFRIAFPARRDLVKRPRDPASPVSKPRYASFALVVDDDLRVREVGARLLERAGYRVEAVGSGRDAVALVEAEAPDVVVLDLTMPGLSGREVLRRIRQGRHPRTPVVLCTGYDASDHELASSEADAFVQKPYTAQDLLNAVADARARALGSD